MGAKFKDLKNVDCEDEIEQIQFICRECRTACRGALSRFLLLFACAALIFAYSFWQLYYISNKSTFSIDREHGVFLKDGEPFRYISGSVHYFRIPRIYWKDRLIKARDAGLNAIQTYVPWNFHEPHPGEYLFDDEKDVVEFIELARQLNLFVLLRVGPYICAEWDFGGLPAWLLSSNPYLKIRSSDREFIDPVIRWFNELLPKLKPLLVQNDGPILMIQLENEYGSYNTCNQKYLSVLYECTRSILGDDVILYTTDGPNMTNLECGSSDRRLLATIDFGVVGVKNPAESFKELERFQPCAPLVNSEYYSGWLNHWGENRAKVDATELVIGANNLWNISQKVSFNIYMFHGGTNFGLWNGANSPTQFHITSYDYDAPISEAGDITSKYIILRNLFFKLQHVDPPPLPFNISKADYGKIGMKFYSHLLCDQQKGVSSVRPLYMEAFKQYRGFAVYSTRLEDMTGKGNLTFENVKDIGLVYTTDHAARSFIFQGSVVGRASLNVITDKEHPVLTIITECRGHINFGPLMVGDIKGIIGRVMLNGRELLNWMMKGLDFRVIKPPDLRGVDIKKTAFPDPGVIYRGVLQIPSTPMDTFAVMTSFTRGVLAVNGHTVGRFYSSIGPQVSLYVPASMLITGENVISILELEKIQPACLRNSSCCSVTFCDSPIWLS